MTIKDILNQIYLLKQPFNLIIADGRFPKTKYLQSLLTVATKIIACDGAVVRLIKHGIPPNYIIGDCDSITANIYQQFSQIIIKDSDQNSNDLTKAVNLAVKLQLDNVVILGATGLREDHTIANIVLLVEFYQSIKHITMISDYGIFTVHQGVANITTIKGQQISLFAPLDGTTVNCKELKWPLTNYSFKLWNSGTLNEATGNNLTIKSNKPIIVYRAFCIK
jgi:thiamine pyrophosphokinase